MSSSAATLCEYSEAFYRDLFEKSHPRDNSHSIVKEENYQRWRSSLDTRGKAEPSPNKSNKENFLENLTQVAPDWQRRLKMGQVRMKTFLKIYLSKWFWRGLDWNEVEFLHILLDRLPFRELEWISNNRQYLTNRLGYQVVMEEMLIDEKRSLYNKGGELWEMQEMTSFVYNQQDFLAVWKLRSVQSLRDFIFVPVTGHEHEGKKGIRKNRIRGYRDGKASPRDPRLIKLALKVDQLFYENEFHQRWDNLEKEIELLSST